MLRVPVHEKGPIALELAHIWATAGPRYQKCPLEPPTPSRLPPRMGCYFARDYFRCVSSPCRATAFVPLGLSKTGSPSTSHQCPGHRGVSVNSSPTKCFRSCFAGHCISTPCQMCLATGNKACCWCKSISHCRGGHKWLQNGVLRPKKAQGAQSGLWWSDKGAKAQTVASGSGPNLAPG